MRQIGLHVKFSEALWFEQEMAKAVRTKPACVGRDEI